MNKVVKRIGALIVAAAVMLTTVPVETLASNKEGKEPYKVVATEATKMKLSAAKKAELDAFIADSFLADCGLDTNEVYVINDRSDFYIDYANSEFKDNGQMAISRVYGVNMQLQDFNMSEVLCLSADGSVVANSERFSIGYNFTGAADFAWNLFDEACMEPLFPYSEYYPVYEGLSQQSRKNDLWVSDIIYYPAGVTKGEDKLQAVSSLFISDTSSLLEGATVVKDKQTIKLTKKSASYKASVLKKASKSFQIGAKAEGKLTYSVASGKKYISVSKTGKVTVKKGTPKGTYKINVKAAATDKYQAASAVVKIVVK